MAGEVLGGDMKTKVVRFIVIAVANRESRVLFLPLLRIRRYRFPLLRGQLLEKTLFQRMS